MLFANFLHFTPFSVTFSTTTFFWTSTVVLAKSAQNCNFLFIKKYLPVDMCHVLWQKREGEEET